MNLLIAAACGAVVWAAIAFPVAVVAGLCLAALLCLFLGDHMFTLAFEVGR